jgi:hypothetical protein
MWLDSTCPKDAFKQRHRNGGIGVTVNRTNHTKTGEKARMLKLNTGMVT